ncbi:MAG: ATP-binding protein [Bdellovibrionota bacterium]
MRAITSFSFLNDTNSRRVIRLVMVTVYFVLFQLLIFLQKPFLQFDFIMGFYLAFSGLFAHHLYSLFKYDPSGVLKQNALYSYLFDFLILIAFMKYFPYLSSFILVLQLFLLFVASFDLDTFELSILGFISSLGASIINLSIYQSGSIQSILSLTLFNLSYLSVIVISRQLRSEFFTLQTDLTQTWKKWKSQDEFSKSLIEKLPFGLAVKPNNQDFVLQNSYLTEKLMLSSEVLHELISTYNSRGALLDSDIVWGSKIYNFDHTTYFDQEVSENLNLYLVKDVTDLRILEKQLKEKEKLAAVGTLAAGIAHEIRNPLAGISGSIQMLSQDTSDPTQKKLMDIVLREIDRLNLLITEFLDYAKPEKKPDTEVDLAKIIDEVINSLKQHPDLAPGFLWKIDISSSLKSKAMIIGFSEKLKQAFLNIMINAIQAMKNSNHPSLEVSLVNDNTSVILSIKDTGLGMSEENRKKMFEPFHTTKPKGTGLGLAITHKILDLHKAEIIVKSELNIGTEFIIKFPLVKGL